MAHSLRAQVAGILLVATAWSGAEAASKRPLSEGEMDQVDAGGIEIVVREPGEGAGPAPSPSPLVVSQVIGDNQLTTDFRLTLSSDALSPQSIEIVQSGGKSSADGALAVGGAAVLRQLAPADLVQKSVMAAVVNSLNGWNQVTTNVNVQIGIPALTLTGPGGGLLVSGFDPSAAGTGATPGAGQPGTPAFQMPTTLAGGINLLESLVPTNPDLAPELADLKALAAPPTSIRSSPQGQTGRRR